MRDNGRRKACKEYSKQQLATALLKIIGAGLLVGAVVVAPNLAVLYKYFNAYTDKDKRRIYFKLRTLTNGGYVTRPGTSYVLTQKGRKELAEDEVWNIPLPERKEAGGGWHLVMYDIPLRLEKGRQALRARLEELGCKRYQDSVYYHRSDLRQTLAPFAEFYGVRHCVRFLYVKNLEGIDS